MPTTIAGKKLSEEAVAMGDIESLGPVSDVMWI
jgi:hypothetical protein